MLAEFAWIRPKNKRVLLMVCLAQVVLIALPFLVNEAASSIIILVLISLGALCGSPTIALLYLCIVSIVVPTHFFDEYLLLPFGFKFYEGLLVVVVGTASISWLTGVPFLRRPRTRLDLPMWVFLALIVISIGIGLYYGQSVSQILRDVRFPLCYIIFFVAAGFFELRYHLTFLLILLICSAVVGIEYLAEFLELINLSVSGSFVRVARIEGLMLPIGLLLVAAIWLYDRSLFRRVISCLAVIPISLALVLTVGRGMWIAVVAGLVFLGGLVVSDWKGGRKEIRRWLILILLPLLVVGVGFFFEEVTRSGLGEIAFDRVLRIINYEGDHSILGRLLSYAVALEKIQQRPLLGGGHGETVTYLVTDRDRPYILTTGGVDNLYLTLLLRMGVVGLLAFLWIFLRGIRIAYWLFKQAPDFRLRLFAAAFISVYGALLVYGMADATMVGNRLIFLHATFLGILARLDLKGRDNVSA